MRTLILLLGASLLLLAGCRTEERPLDIADRLLDRGIELYEDQSFRQAETQLTQAIPMYTEQHQYSRLAKTYAYLGRVYLNTGQFGLALEDIESALAQCRIDNYFRGEAEYTRLLGDAYMELAEFREAVDRYKSSRALSAAFDDKLSVAIIDLRLGRAFCRLQRYEEALGSYTSALNYYRTAGEDAGTAEALAGIGEVYADQGHSGEALNSLRQALDAVDPADQPDIDARIHLTAGGVYLSLGDRNAALRFFRDGANRLRARRSGQRYEVLLIFRIGTVYLESGRFDEARKFFSEAASAARTVGDRIAEQYLYVYLLRCNELLMPAQQRQQQRSRIAAAYIQLADRFNECAYRSGESYARYQAGLLLAEDGRWSEARTQYARAVEVEENRYGEYASPDFHRLYLQDLQIEKLRTEWFTTLADALVGQKRPEEALLYLERASLHEYARTLLGVQFEARHRPLADVVRELQIRLQRIRMEQRELGGMLANRLVQPPPGQVESLRKSISQSLKEIEQDARVIASTHPNYLPLAPVVTPGVSDLLSSIPRGTLLLRYLPGDQKLLIFALKRTGFQVRSVPIGRRSLEAKITEYVSLLHDPSVYTGAAGDVSLAAMTKFALLSGELYELLLRPVDALMERNLIIVPSGLFVNFPFHALERHEASGAVRYLVELTSVDYLPTISSLRFKTAGTARIRDIAAMGDPDGKNWSVDYELRDLRSFFKGTYILIGSEATWDRLQAVRGDVLQLSSGFTVGEGIPAFGTITLADPGTLEKTVDVPFQNLLQMPTFPVVVLSNDVGSGFGLTPAQGLLLRMSGTADVFYNGWYADRRSAKFFSEYFYTHLANGLAPGDAYRQALLSLIRTPDVRHPHQWGQFFHIGVG